MSIGKCLSLLSQGKSNPKNERRQKMELFFAKLVFKFYVVMVCKPNSKRILVNLEGRSGVERG